MKIAATLATFIAQAAINEPYRQIDFLTTQELERWLHDRDMKIPWTAIHRLWSLGYLHPILVLEPAAAAEGHLDGRFLPVDVGFPDPTFIDLGVNEDAIEPFAWGDTIAPQLSSQLLWHPMQLWQIETLYRFLTLHFGAVFGVSDPEWVVDVVRKQVNENRSRLLSFGRSTQQHEFLKVLAVLLSAEPLVHDQITYRYTYAPHRGESAHGYFEWRESYDGCNIVDHVEISTETLVTWHDRLAWAAKITDPLEHWRILTRHVSRDWRERLKGTARRANDLYDAAEVLRRYLEQYHEQELPEEDDVGRGPAGANFKERRYGSRRTADFNRVALRRIARDYRVDPQARMVFFVEGSTEVEFYLCLAKRNLIDLDAAGIEIFDLGGVGGLNSSRMRSLLDLFQKSEVFVLVAVDEDNRGDHIRNVVHYTQQRLILPQSRVWSPDFEVANFTLAELAAIATYVARDNNVDCLITEEMLADEMSASGRPAAESIVKLWNRATYYGGKGVIWGRALAKWCDGPDSKPGFPATDETRPAVELLTLLLRAQTSDYQTTFSRD